MFNSAFMLSLRAAVAGSTMILAAAAQPVHAQTDVKSPSPRFAKEPLDAQRAAAINAAAMKQDAAPAMPRPKGGAAAFLPADRFDQPVYSVSADGSIWARGRTYKARFAANGFTYIPFFGGEAPQNHPIDLALDAITIDGEPTALDAPVVTRDGDRITINRGAVHEIYELNADSVEQLFVFPTELSNGETLIRMHAKSELSRSQASGVIKFSNDLGSVSYSNAIAIDAFNDQNALPTQLTENQTIEITLSASLMAGAKYPLTVDPVMTTFVLDAPEGTGTLDGYSDIAYDPDTSSWMLVWEENFSAQDGDIYTMRCDPSGQPVGGTLATINGDGVNARNPAIANNRLHDKFFVAYEKGEIGSRSVWGRWRNPLNAIVGADFQISENANPGDHHSPDVGGDPNTLGPTYFCVVWQRDASVSDTDIFARLIDVPGNAGFGASKYISNSSNTLDRVPAISNSNGNVAAPDQNWIIVFERKLSSTDYDILGAQISWDGVVTHTVYPIDTTGADDRFPSVSTLLPGSNMYMVVYEENNQFIYGRVYQDTTLIMGDNLTDLENSTPSLQAKAPSVDSNADKFVVSYQQTIPGWTDWDVFASTFCVDGGSIRVSDIHKPVSMTAQHEVRINVATAFAAGAQSGNRNAMITMTRLDSTNHGEIRGALYTLHNSCCATDIAPIGGDGQTNVTDLLAVISQWGQGWDATANVNGDGAVNVTDLLAVISAWGACP